MKHVATLIVRQIPDNIPIDTLHRLYREEDNLRLISAAFGYIIDVKVFDVNRGGMAFDRVELASFVLNMDADQFELLQGFAAMLNNEDTDDTEGVVGDNE